MKRKILICPYSKPLRNGNNNPKNYPYWLELVLKLKNLNYNVIQIGYFDEKKIFGVDEFKKDLNFKELKNELDNCYTWISVDNFFHHFSTFYKKPGIVIFSQSDPKIYGYEQNINLLKDRKYLRSDQFGIWEMTTYNKDAYIKPDEVLKYISNF